MPRAPINVTCPDHDSVRPMMPPRGHTEAYIQITDTELKIKLLAESIAKDFLPLDFNNNDAIKVKPADELLDTAYIYVDNGGTPVKVFAPAVLRTAIN